MLKLLVNEEKVLEEIKENSKGGHLSYQLFIFFRLLAPVLLNLHVV